MNLHSSSELVAWKCFPKLVLFCLLMSMFKLTEVDLLMSTTGKSRYLVWRCWKSYSPPKTPEKLVCHVQHCATWAYEVHKKGTVLAAPENLHVLFPTVIFPSCGGTANSQM